MLVMQRGFEFCILHSILHALTVHFWGSCLVHSFNSEKLLALRSTMSSFRSIEFCGVPPACCGAWDHAPGAVYSTITHDAVEFLFSFQGRMVLYLFFNLLQFAAWWHRRLERVRAAKTPHLLFMFCPNLQAYPDSEHVNTVSFSWRYFFWCGHCTLSSIINDAIDYNKRNIP